ncbi:hypothetical protein TNCT_91421 [Trichonephila clavata]|uniref:Uncharacterized protein n=1 Tax=Trichonephila clavata TaxID=2740835 RepID=A0A8X6J5D3_TRICU|nr:hypothetical protein TNCT_91421 [Trichonephila clavata]
MYVICVVQLGRNDYGFELMKNDMFYVGQISSFSLTSRSFTENMMHLPHMWFPFTPGFVTALMDKDRSAKMTWISQPQSSWISRFESDKLNIEGQMRNGSLDLLDVIRLQCKH